MITDNQVKWDMWAFISLVMLFALFLNPALSWFIKTYNMTPFMQAIITAVFCLPFVARAFLSARQSWIFENSEKRPYGRDLNHYVIPFAIVEVAAAAVFAAYTFSIYFLR